MISPYRLSFNHWQQYEGVGCLNKYSTYKEEIEKKINNFYRITNGNFYTQWQQLNEYIKQKNNEIKNCAGKKSTSLNLFADDKIKDFSTLCPNKSACLTKPLSLAKNNALLQSGAKGPCKGNSCQQQKKQTKSPKAETLPLLPRESSNAISSPNLKTKNPVEEHPKREESKQLVVTSHAHQDPKHQDNLVQTEGGSPESLDIHNTARSELEQTSAQHASLPAPVRTTELSTEQNSHSSPRSVSEESAASNSSQEIGSKGSTLQSGIPADQTSDDNLLNFQSIKGITDVNQDPNNPKVRTEIEDDLSPGEDPFSTKVGNENPARTSPGDVSSSSTDATCTDTDKTNIPHASSCDKTYNDRFTNRETYSDEAAHGLFVSGEGTVSAGFRSAEKGDEVDTNNDNILDTLSEFFNGIPNNPQIIKTSAPIGIALLLGLLFKYTPLWRVLTKKNRKKGADINEELNSALQEPSIMDDERSIPFSYGAFEYSSFDQNVY
ncbi:PIR protein [Plasmodium vivax]|uniref:VIR protein n=1 Tax=Plasmodium vivax TaxID=5855 RepID=A0A565A4Y8_PLAVI|nr:PIR protein [Plasmodium vivax]